MAIWTIRIKGTLSSAGIFFAFGLIVSPVMEEMLFGISGNKGGASDTEKGKVALI